MERECGKTEEKFYREWKPEEGRPNFSGPGGLIIGRALERGKISRELADELKAEMVGIERNTPKYKKALLNLKIRIQQEQR